MDIKDILSEIISNYGYIGIFISVMLEYANVPLPSELILPLVGVLSVGKNISLIVAIGVSVIAGLVGSIVNYYIGYFYGNKIIELVSNRYNKVEVSINKSYKFINKNKKMALMISRVIPGIRTLISLVAGSVHINSMEFIGYSFIGIFIWNSILIFSGYIVGDNLDLIYTYLSNYSLLLLGVIFILLMGLGYKYLKNKKSKDSYTNL